MFANERTLTHIDHGRQQLLPASELVSPAAVAPDVVSLKSLAAGGRRQQRSDRADAVLSGDSEPARAQVSVLSPFVVNRPGLRASPIAYW